jgi:hypothetical protein
MATQYNTTQHNNTTPLVLLDIQNNIVQAYSYTSAPYDTNHSHRLLARETTSIQEDGESIGHYIEIGFQTIVSFSSMYIMKKSMINRELDAGDIKITLLLLTAFIGAKIAAEYIENDIISNTLVEFFKGAFSSSIYRTLKPFDDAYILDHASIAKTPHIHFEDLSKSTNKIEQFFIKTSAASLQKFMTKTVGIGFVGETITNLTGYGEYKISSALQDDENKPQEYDNFISTKMIFASSTLMYMLFFWGAQITEASNFCVLGAMARIVSFLLTAHTHAEEGWGSWSAKLLAQPFAGCAQYSVIKLPKFFDNDHHLTWALTGGLSDGVAELIEGFAEYGGEQLAIALYGEENTFNNDVDNENDITNEMIDGG